MNRKRWFPAIVFVAIVAGVFAILPRSTNHPQPKDFWPPASQYLAAHPDQAGDARDTSQYVRMRDGVRIAVTTTMPSSVHEGQRVPAVLRIARYWRRWDIRWPANVLARDPKDPSLALLNHGYVLVNVDVRGSGASFGSWPYAYSDTELKDSAEVVDWIVKQPWSNGAVGTWGFSFESVSALLLLSTRHPAIKACFFDRGAFDVYEDFTHPGGVPGLAPAGLQTVLRLLDQNQIPPDRAPPWFLKPFFRGVVPVDGPEGRALLSQALSEHQGNSDLAQLTAQVTFRDDAVRPYGLAEDSIGPSAKADEIGASGTPVLILQGWFDDPGAGVKTYARLKNPRHLILGPWNHYLQNASPFAGWHGSGFDPRGEILRFFDHYLKGLDNGYEDLNPIQYYTLGAEQWRLRKDWPPATDTSRLYLEQDAHLSDSTPSASDSFDRYDVDTTFQPAPGPSNILTDLAAAYPDRRASDSRTMHYTSGALTGKLEIAGAPQIHLWVNSTAADGEFFAYLEDVQEDESVQYVTSGGLRAIHRREGGVDAGAQPRRHSYRRADAMPLVPGEPAQIIFDLAPTSYQFLSGHRIRITFSGADTSKFATLPGPAPTWRIYRDRLRTSSLMLPVVKDGM
jgi:putative CocE/NonD family hydrolase